MKDYEYFLINCQNNSNLNLTGTLNILSRLIYESVKYEDVKNKISDEFIKKLFDYFENSFKSKEYSRNIFHVISLSTIIIQTIIH